MTELRKDPILGEWVIVAPERATRPFDHREGEQPAADGLCPFCRGNEQATPEAIMIVARDGSPHGEPCDDWLVRIIPNRYPAVSAPSSMSLTSDNFERSPAPGYHEVIIESPSHDKAMRDLSNDQLLLVLRAWRDRLAAVSSDEIIAHTMIFKNEGAAAGASLEHVHSQLLATSYVPARIDAELDAGHQHFMRTGNNLWTEMLDRELSTDTRVIAQNEQFVLLCPFASRIPGEMCLLPQVHSPSFEETLDASLPSLATFLKNALGTLNSVFPETPLNLSLHTAPPRDQRRSSYHWHLSITPRLTGIAGFEIGAGSWINIIAPEDAASRYRLVMEQSD